LEKRRLHYFWPAHGSCNGYLVNLALLINRLCKNESTFPQAIAFRGALGRCCSNGPVHMSHSFMLFFTRGVGK
jgi:hypothetical protein